MSRKAYSDDERKQIRDKLISTGLEFLGTYGVTQTSVENLCKVVGISKTFFYSFFPSKEEFITQVLYHQQPKLLEHAKGLMKLVVKEFRNSRNRRAKSETDNKRERI